MCDTCGCSHSKISLTVKAPGAKSIHDHYHSPQKKIEIQEDVLSKNNLLAQENRRFLKNKNIRTFNLVSSPGSGKTTLLEKTIIALKKNLSIAVIEGDQQTFRDAERIEATGVPAVQINTGTGCHLDAEMIARALQSLPLQDNSLLFIENVGNLVCPAMFDLGEDAKIVIISVTEGDDKPLKYPGMFHAADICVITKTDLSPYVDFEIAACKENALAVNPRLKFFILSAKTGEGMGEWLDWLSHR
ncbi:MAG: hydrogenase nickel incorporation protein HypB [Proteobacteria bacterium]|nr:hydrogenase nickel incorporation protein HypB [Pseudomonadota bacterium]MBU1708695.1 hydrogenase nickel incorporation protein HypB [Pseudomonadota bacterium]